MTTTHQQFAGFVHARGNSIIDGAGHVYIPRGIGIGNWLLPEGYMWKFSAAADSPRKIEALIERLVGREAAMTFWADFRTAFFNEEDVRRIAAFGFDHIRLPINAKVLQNEDGSFKEDGFDLIDDVIRWCRTAGLYVILDLHGAPGGQTGTNIDDSPNLKPELFMDARYRTLTVALWEEIAARYRNETAIMAYDLLNEPLPNEWQHTYSKELVALYKNLTRAIRAIDPDHLIMYEGAHWATSFEMFTEVWDQNSVLHFHRYWCPPDRRSIRYFLNKRTELGLPIFLGESGENNPEWLFAMFQMNEAHGIGWNLWTWKKIDTRTSPMSIRPPQGWERIISYAEGGSGPSAGETRRILRDLIQAMHVEACDVRDDVVAAVFGRDPSVIPAWAFGYRGAGVSYHVTKSVEGELRKESGVPVVSSGPEEPRFDHVEGRLPTAAEALTVSLDTGDWLEFEFIRTSGSSFQAVTAEGGPAPVSVTNSARGVQVLAERPTRFARLIRAD